MFPVMPCTTSGWPLDLLHLIESHDFCSSPLETFISSPNQEEKAKLSGTKWKHTHYPDTSPVLSSKMSDSNGNPVNICTSIFLASIQSNLIHSPFHPHTLPQTQESKPHLKY